MQTEACKFGSGRLLAFIFPLISRPQLLSYITRDKTNLGRSEPLILSIMGHRDGDEIVIKPLGFSGQSCFVDFGVVHPIPLKLSSSIHVLMFKINVINI